MNKINIILIFNSSNKNHYKYVKLKKNKNLQSKNYYRNLQLIKLNWPKFITRKTSLYYLKIKFKNS